MKRPVAWILLVLVCSGLAANEKPYFTSTPVTAVDENEFYQYKITVSDADNDTLFFILNEKPHELSFTDFGNDTALLSGTLTSNLLNDVSISVTDGIDTVTQEFQILVYCKNCCLEFMSQPVTMASVDSLYSYHIIAQGIDDNVLLSVDTIPNWLSFEAQNPGQAILSGIPTISDTGSYQMTIIAERESVLCPSTTFQPIEIKVSLYIPDQLQADAGDDTIVCEDAPTLYIGGHPTATGGIPPYTYSWQGSYEAGHHLITASFILDDTTVANPKFKEHAIPDSVKLFVTVVDDSGSSASDSIMIRMSRYFLCLGECREYIDYGDSVQLYHCIFGGIPPLHFAWEPSESLSDPSLWNPWAKPTITTHYSLTVTDSKGCIVTNSCNVIVFPASYRDGTKQPQISLYPNPASEILMIRFHRSDFLNTSFELFNSTGKSVYHTQIRQQEQVVHTRGFAPGVYLFKWKSGNQMLESGTIMIGK